MEQTTKIESCIKIIKTLPVNQMDKNISAISSLIYDDDELLDNFLQKVDNRQEICEDNGFIKSEYNRDGDSYRSPIDNNYYPPMEDGRKPSPELRALEIILNKIFSLYTTSYYITNNSQGLCSCYCWNLGEKIENGFAVAVLIRHSSDAYINVSQSGIWESSNVVNVNFENQDGGPTKCNYKLTTYLQLKLTFNDNNFGLGNISGTLAKQVNLNNLDL